MLSNDISQRRWDGVADLHTDFDTLTTELEVIGEALQACRFSVGNRAMLLGVEVATFLWLVELGAYRHGWTIPPQPAHQVGAAFGLANPARRRDLFRQVETITTGRDGFVAFKGQRRRVASNVPVFFGGFRWQVADCVSTRVGDQNVNRVSVLNPCYNRTGLTYMPSCPS